VDLAKGEEDNRKVTGGEVVGRRGAKGKAENRGLVEGLIVLNTNSGYDRVIYNTRG